MCAAGDVAGLPDAESWGRLCTRPKGEDVASPPALTLSYPGRKA